ncbi:MAG: amino acid permease, partial [Steroidobacteraceae bacterium]
WSYWFNWVVSVMAETTAIGIYVRFWNPAIPQWLPPLVVLVALYGTNLVAVRVFGELEYWFALIKVVAILGLILAGLGVIFFHFGHFGSQASFSNLWTHGGFLPFGTLGVLLTLQIVMFAYSGVELIGVTAGEAENPSVVLPRATNGIIFRILIFYLGALLVIMALVPWNQLSPDTSPFVFVFQKLGIPAAASIINIVVITAAASSCNSGIFSTGRMLCSLAYRGQSPRVFAAVNGQNVPAAAIHASAAVMLIGVFLNYEVPQHVFAWVTSIVLIGTLWPWGIIMAAHLGYRRAVREGRVAAASFRMPGAPVVNWLVIAFLLFVTAMLWLQPDTRVALYVAPFWFGLLAVSYFFLVKPQAVRAA